MSHVLDPSLAANHINVQIPAQIHSILPDDEMDEKGRDNAEKSGNKQEIL